MPPELLSSKAQDAERELMDWYDKQPSEFKWRLTRHIESTGDRLADSLRMFKAVDDMSKAMDETAARTNRRVTLINVKHH